MQTYLGHGVRFQYPDDWQLSEQQSDKDSRQDVVVSVESPGTTYWSLTLLADRPDPQRVVDQAVQAFADEYSSLDVYPAADGHLDAEHVGKDLQFFQYELINNAGLRAFESGPRTALVLFQSTDHEWEDLQEVLSAITASLILQDPDDPGFFWPH